MDYRLTKEELEAAFENTRSAELHDALASADKLDLLDQDYVDIMADADIFISINCPNDKMPDEKIPAFEAALVTAYKKGVLSGLSVTVYYTQQRGKATKLGFTTHHSLKRDELSWNMDRSQENELILSVFRQVLLHGVFPPGPRNAPTNLHIHTTDSDSFRQKLRGTILQ